MAYFAKLGEWNEVTDVVIIGDDDCGEGDFAEREQAGIAKAIQEFGEGTYVMTCRHGSFRTRYAGQGMIYDAERDAFIFPQPWPSWTLNEEGIWVAPVEGPDDTSKRWFWNEDTQEWVGLPRPSNPFIHILG